MYRVLLAQETNKDPSSSNGGGAGSSSSPAANAAAAQELEAMKSRVHELERVRRSIAFVVVVVVPVHSFSLLQY